MSMDMKELFCNECGLSVAIPYIVAREVLGMEQLELTERRYEVMRENYGYGYAEWQGRFGEGMRPFRGYKDTTSVTMRVSHPYFRQEIEATCKGAIGVDLPTWFNCGAERRHIMIIAQAPLRSNKWYGECVDAVVSSPFGLHDREHRERGNGGKMVNLLVRELTAQGYGVYLTDVDKYFIYDRETTARFAQRCRERYAEVLRREMLCVSPRICVCFGTEARDAARELGVENLLALPHVSGAARGAMVRRFPELKEEGATAENAARVYAEEILKQI